MCWDLHYPGWYMTAPNRRLISDRKILQCNALKGGRKSTRSLESSSPSVSSPSWGGGGACWAAVAVATAAALARFFLRFLLWPSSLSFSESVKESILFSIRCKVGYFRLIFWAPLRNRCIPQGSDGLSFWENSGVFSGKNEFFKFPYLVKSSRALSF